MKKITVIGSTGMIGIPVTKALVNAGFEVTALVRNIEKAKEIFPVGVTFVKGDLENTHSLDVALENAEGLYINISTRAEDKEHQFNPENQGLDAILAAAKRQANLKQVVFLSSFLARNYKGDWWVFKAKKSSIQRVKTADLPYTIFYPSNFMENLVSEGMLRNNKLTGIKSKANNKAWWIAGDDFGKMVAAAFQTEKAINQEFPAQGPEPMTMMEAVERFAKAYPGGPLKTGAFPLGVMKFLSVFISPLKFVAKLMEVMLNNQETFESQKTWELLHQSEITIENFAKKQKA